MSESYGLCAWIDDDGVPCIYIDGRRSQDEHAAAELLKGRLVLPGDLTEPEEGPRPTSPALTSRTGAAPSVRGSASPSPFSNPLASTERQTP